jgi:hypothetical protein
LPVSKHCRKWPRYNPDHPKAVLGVTGFGEIREPLKKFVRETNLPLKPHLQLDSEVIQ